jgi:stearoyl-CoA desaturase (Delta-9 desaturase)
MHAIVESPSGVAEAVEDVDVAPSAAGLFAGRAITLVLVAGPLIAIALAVVFLWGRLFSVHDLALTALFYLVTGFGVTVGYHRLLTHRSFRARRWLKVALASAGSLAVEGSPISWVANHRRHHRFSDRPGDPHSPHLRGNEVMGQLRGFAHAHVGWLFGNDPTAARRYAPELLDDRDCLLISRLFPLFAVFSLVAPFLLGWLISGAIGGALTALLWAGVARMALLHHVTWSVNSVCHMFGKQPATQRDRSTNFAFLSVISFGESWHNFHHAHPASARHGALAHQIDPSAALIRVFERFGCATHVRWPTDLQIAACKVG